MTGINRQPYGLLSLLGIKNSGRNPADLNAVLTPVIDLAPWYLYQNAESINANANIAAVGFTPIPALQIPVTETWAILGCSVNTVAALGAGQGLQFAGVFAPSANVTPAYPLTVLSPDGTTGTVVAGLGPPGTIVWAGAGSALGFFCTTLTAGPVNCTMNLRICRMLA